MISSYVAQWVQAFLLSLVVEVPIVLGLTRAIPAPLWKRAAFAFFATLATHPIVWFVIPELGVRDPARLMLSEAWAFGAELVFYKLVFDGLTWARAALASVVANTASFGLGALMWLSASP